jgi:hypothetical protein
VRIRAFSVKNYKSFPDSEGGSGTLSEGINVIVGQNNAGKTALLEALTIRATDVQHRSLATHPVPEAVVHSRPSTTLDVTVTRDEWRPLVADHVGHFVLAAPNGSAQAALTLLDEAFDPELLVRITHSPGPGITGEIVGYRGAGTDAHFDVRRPVLQPEPVSGGSIIPLGRALAQAISQRMYLFGAERFRAGEGAFGHQPTLAPDARNLPEVLNRLQSNPDLHAHFNALVRRVLPPVRWISVKPIQNNQLRVLVWTVDPASRRVDLAVPLNQSGTGIGQVLAMLYVVTSPGAEIIAIDEPQSFLHPGAVRALIEILREHSRHQFVVTTHSPVALSAARPDTILHVRQDNGVSSVSRLRSDEAKELGTLLADLGVRMEDVFGFDSLLWVEGRTEELCFPLIIRRLLQRPFARTGILGLVATGDLEGRHRELAFEIYSRLSEGAALLPPAVAFIFDRERRTDRRIEEMVRRRAGKVSLLPRRMYENYLLDPEAIAAVAESTEGFGNVTPESVEEWLEHRRWDPVLFAPGGLPPDRSEESWNENVSGANVLSRIFTELSETRVSYDKAKHGQALTEWILEHNPALLQPLADFIDARLPPA